MRLRPNGSLTVGQIASMVALVALGSVVIASAAAGGSPTGGGLGVSQQASGQWQLEADLVAAVQMARLRLGSQYGDSVIENSTRTWTIFSTGDVPQDLLADIAAKTKGKVQVEVRRVERSREQLLAIQQLVATLARTPAGRNINGSYLKAETNQVHVDVAPESSSELVALVLALAGAGSIEVSRTDSYLRPDTSDGSDAARAAAESQLDGRPPYKAGKYARVNDGPEERCTSGYV